MKETIYIVSRATVYDSDLEMFGTKAGIKDKSMPLLFTAWGTTAEESKLRAEMLIEKLKN